MRTEAPGSEPARRGSVTLQWRTGERLGLRVPAPASSYRFSITLGGFAAPLGLGFCHWQLAFFPSSPVEGSPSSFRLLHPAQDQARGEQAPPLPTGAQCSREHGEWSPGSKSALRDICFFHAPATPSPLTLTPSPLFPRLQSHGILRMLERWR